MNKLIETKTEKIYENIAFEKNVYLSACDYLKNFNKILIMTSPTPQKSYLQHFINVLSEHDINFQVNTIYKSQICTSDVILATCAKIKDCDLIISFGAGKIADISKIVAKQLSIPYCVIPTTISHYGLFNNVAYLLDNDFPKIITTKYPEKVFIDLDIVKKSPEQFVFSTICFAVSLLEKLFVLEVKLNVLNECDVNLCALNKKIRRIEELLNWLSLSKDFALLNLMDYIIDLQEICKDAYTSNSISYSLILSSSALKHNFGKKCLLSSSILLNLYSVLFGLKNIEIQRLPDRDSIVKNLSKHGKDSVIFDKYIEVSLPIMDGKIKSLLNLHKKRLFQSLSFLKSFLNKFAKKLSFIESPISRSADQNVVFSSLSVLPFVADDFVLNILCRYGLLNIF